MIKVAVFGFGLLFGVPAALADARSDCEGLGNPDKIIKACSEVIRADPKSRMGYLSRGSAYETKGDKARAIADYTKAIEIDPKAEYPYYKRAIAYEEKGDKALAIADFTKIVELKPQNKALVKVAIEHIEKLKR